MLVQLLRTQTKSINESLTKSCYSRVDVCTGAIAEEWMQKESNEKDRTCVPDDFASKFVIHTMVRNTIKHALVNSICSNMKQYGMWMVYTACKSINKSCITNMNSDRIMSKNENCNSNSKYSQHNITCWFSTWKATTTAVNQRVLI